MKWFAIFSMSLILAGLLTDPVAAEGPAGQWINSNDVDNNGVARAFDKFGRGLENTILGVFEIPKQTVKRAVDTDSSSSYISGFFLGIGYFVLRELAGVYEIVTFPIPVPRGYEPVMDPLFGYQPEIVPK